VKAVLAISCKYPLQQVCLELVAVELSFPPMADGQLTARFVVVPKPMPLPVPQVQKALVLYSLDHQDALFVVWSPVPSPSALHQPLCCQMIGNARRANGHPLTTLYRTCHQEGEAA